MFRQNYNGVDANGAEFKSRDFLPEEIFAVKIEKAYEKVTKTVNRYPMVNIMLRVTEEGDHHGKVIWDNIVFCEAMKGRNKHLLKVLEQPFEGEVDVAPGEWLNQDLRIKVKHEMHKGKPVPKVGQYLYKDGTLKEEEEEEKKEGTQKKPVKPEEQKRPIEEFVETEDYETDDEEVPF